MSNILDDLKEEMNSLSLNIADAESRLLAMEEELSQLKSVKLRYISEYQKVLSKLTVYSNILNEVKEKEKPKKLVSVDSVSTEDKYQDIPKKSRNNVLGTN